MKKLFLLVSILIFSFMVIKPVLAQVEEVSDVTGRFGIGYRFGWVEEEDNVLNREEIEWGHSINLIYGVHEYAALQLEGGYAIDNDVDEELYSLYIDLILKKPIQQYVPYGFLGLGFQSYDSGDLFETDDTFSGRIGGGLEYFLDKSLAINAEALYFEGGNETFDGWQVRGGIRFYFP